MKNSNDFFSKNYVINEMIVKEVKNLNLNIDEFILLLYFINSDTQKLDVQNICSHTAYKEVEVLAIINSLVEKKLLDLVTKKDERGKLADFVNLDGLQVYLQQTKSNQKEATKTDIYTIFEKEFGRTISSMEYEIINAWLEKDFSEELIKLALKEAVYNGVSNLRYIDKILFEWQKNGIKNKSDYEAYNAKRKSHKKMADDLFDYDWLSDESE